MVAKAAHPALHDGRHGLSARAWWPVTKRVLTVLFFALVVWLLVSQARHIDWSTVMSTLGDYAPRTLLTAALLAACSFALYTTFDLIGRRYTGHLLPTRQVMAVSFISYVFNLNLGSLVGGFAFRYRLYAKFGLPNDVITRVLGMSMLTNWLGYLVLAGLAFCFGPLTLPDDWKIDSHSLPVLGAVLLAVAAAYLLLCRFSRKRSFMLRSHELKLPSARVALLQLAVSSLNWSLMAGVVFTLLHHRVDYVTVLSVLLIGAVAGVITHVPAGLGVLEAVFVALLSSRVPDIELLAALLAYRGIYYLGPLVIATLLLAGVEWRFRRRGTAALAPPRLALHRKAGQKA